MTQTGSEPLLPKGVLGPTFRPDAIEGSLSVSAHTFNVVERFFNKIKQCRRVATRYDKLAANYLAFIQLASIRLWLRVYEFTALVKTDGVGIFRQEWKLAFPLSALSAGIKKRQSPNVIQ